MTRFGRAGITGGDLAQMWRNAALFLPHMAGCVCAGPHLSLDRDSIEADLVAHLVQIYREGGHSSLARFVAAHEDQSDPKPSFTAWLAALDTASLDTLDRDRLIADLKSALDSLNSIDSGRIFSCE